MTCPVPCTPPTAAFPTASSPRGWWLAADATATSEHPHTTRLLHAVLTQHPRFRPAGHALASPVTRVAAPDSPTRSRSHRPTRPEWPPAASTPPPRVTR